MNLSYSKRTIRIQPTSYCLILFFAMLVGVLFGCLFYSFSHVRYVHTSESVLSAFLSAVLFLLTVFFLSSFSIGKLLCIFVFFLHGFLFTFSAFVFSFDLRAFLCLCLRESFLLIGAYYSVIFHRRAASRLIFPLAFILLISVLGTLFI